MSGTKTETSKNRDPHTMTKEECKKVYFDAVRKYREKERKRMERQDDLDFFEQFNGGRWCHYKNRDSINAELTCLDCGMVLPSMPYFYKEYYHNCHNVRNDSTRARFMKRDFTALKKYDQSKKPCAHARLDRVTARCGVSQYRDLIRDDFVRVVNDGDAPPGVNVTVICYQLLLKNGVAVDKSRFKLPGDTMHGDYVRRFCAFLLKKVGWTLVDDM